MSAFYHIVAEMEINLWLHYKVIYWLAARYRML